MISSRFLADVAVGLLAGAVGARVKAGSESFLQEWAEQVLPPEPGQKSLPGADPAGRSDRMPPALLYRRLLVLRGRSEAEVAAMDDEQIQAGAVWLHRLMAYGYPVLYAVATRRVPALETGGGLLGGLALFGATHGSLLPALDVQAPVAALPRAWWVWEGGSHALYGTAVGATVGLLRLVTR